MPRPPVRLLLDQLETAIAAGDAGRRVWNQTTGCWDHRLYITDRGRQHYREHWRRYMEFYPEVEAPEPEPE